MMKKYINQICQDDELNKKFRKLHGDIVDMIAKFCHDNNIVIDDFYLSGDGFESSCKEGEWKSECDSSFSLIKYTDRYKELFYDFAEPINEDEFKKVELEQKAFLTSM